MLYYLFYIFRDFFWPSQVTFQDLLYWYLIGLAKSQKFCLLRNLWRYSFGQEKTTFWGQHILSNVVAHFGHFYSQNVFMKSNTFKGIFLGHFVVQIWAWSLYKINPWSLEMAIFLLPHLKALSQEWALLLFLPSVSCTFLVSE